MKTALIVDDHHDNRYLLRTILAASGYDPLEASNGAEALEQARHARPAIIISDILMPQMDGFSLCRACKRDSTLSEIPFVFYTATYTSPSDERLAKTLGAARFIVKPVSDDVFLSVIADVLEEHATGRLVVPSPPAEDETVYYRLYNEVLIHKLEKKVLDLEQEIAERRRAEAATKEGDLRLQAAINAANVGLWDWDLRTNSVFYSPEWKRQIGFADHEISGSISEWWDRLHENDRQRTIATVHAFVQKRRPDYDVEFRFLHRDGSYRWILSQASLVEDDHGTPLRVLGSHVDITARKRADAEREHLQAQLAQAQKLEAVGRLAGGIAHDFNNALSVIIGSAELALDTVGANNAVREDLQSIHDAARRGAEIVRQLLTFARKETVSPVVLNPNDALTSLQGMLARLIGEDLTLTMSLQSDAWSIRIDPTQFDQVIINLFTNARDAMSNGGTIRVTTTNVTLDEEDVRRSPGMAPGEYLSLQVTDTGTGMDSATREQIFEPFFTTKSQSGGSGLGLSTVFGIVERGGGRIDVVSALAQGTTITIYLPRCQQDALTHPQQTATIPPAAGETVLVVEDNPALLNIVRRTLESYSYRVLGAASANDAIALSQGRDQPIDLLVTDIVMPVMNGKELAECIRTYQPGLRVLYMSGYPAEIVAQRNILNATDPYLQKPFSPDALAEKAREILSNETPHR